MNKPSVEDANLGPPELSQGQRLADWMVAHEKLIESLSEEELAKVASLELGLPVTVVAIQAVSFCVQHAREHGFLDEQT